MKKILLSAIGVVLLGAAISAFVSAKNESDDGILGLNVKALAYDNCNYNIEKSSLTVGGHEQL